MKRTYSVHLNDVLVGHLAEGDDSRIAFRMHERYRSLTERPVLSQSFEDNLQRVYRGKDSSLPPFFANLTPEGPLREMIETSLHLPHSDELALLESVGADLPGAVTIAPSEDLENGFAENGGTERAVTTKESDDSTLKLRFSLAGVQLKFSVLREAEKITLPVQGQGGEWIVKLDSSRFPRLTENEYATLQWARASGFDVPECYLQPVTALDDQLRGYAPKDSRVLVIRRYDRADNRRIHQEDFAQVVNLPPDLKYDHITYEQCAALVHKIIGESAYGEFIRRLAFVVISGNSDAHLKNWSLVYPDGINAQLSPLYDQVSIVAWPEIPAELSLKFATVKPLLKVDEETFARLAERAQIDAVRTLKILRQAIEEILAGWRESGASEIMPEEHTNALESYWKRLPLLKSFLS